jgi:hypothetical protein
MAAGHEVAGARHTGRLNEKLAVGANRLKTVMFDDKGFPPQEAKDERRERRAGNVNDIGFSKELPEWKEAWLANHAEWICAVVEIPRRSLRHQRNFELPRAVRIAESGESASEGENDRFDPANAWRKKMRIE